MPEQLLSPRGAAEYAESRWGHRWSVSTIRRWISVGHVSAQETPAGYLIPVSEIDRVHEEVDPRSDGNS